MTNTGIFSGIGMILLLVVLVVVIIALLVKRDIGKQEKNLKKDKEYISISLKMMQEIRDKLPDSSLQKKAGQLCDILKASPVRSGEEVKAVEDEIMKKLSFLQIFAAEQSSEEIEKMLDELHRLMNARNENAKRTV